MVYNGSGSSAGNANGAVTIKEGLEKAGLEVTNTGDSYAGKDVIELYCETPYTPGGIEKSKVALCAFEKTALLQPGETGTYSLSVALEDIASYDENNKRSTDEVVASNQFADAKNDIPELSRADGFANAKDTIFSEIEDIALEKKMQCMIYLLINPPKPESIREKY